MIYFIECGEFMMGVCRPSCLGLPLLALACRALPASRFLLVLAPEKGRQKEKRKRDKYRGRQRKGREKRVGQATPSPGLATSSSIYVILCFVFFEFAKGPADSGTL